MMFKDDTYTIGARSLRPGLPPLDPATTMDFLRYYACTCDGQLDHSMTTDDLKSQARMTTKSLKVQAERFFALFARMTGNIVPVQDRTRIYYVSEFWLLMASI